MKKLTTEEFIAKAKEKHGDYYDYSKTTYVNSREYLTITCPKHGDFMQKGAGHLSGYGCSKCGVDKQSGPRKTTEDFIKECVSVHGDYYDYSKTIYVSAHDKITVICKEHGEFEQVANEHLRGKGCVKCSYERRADKRRYDKDVLTDKLNALDDGKYKVVGEIEDYKNISQTITFNCEKHGDFQQKIILRLTGRACPKCANNISYKEQEVAAFVKSLSVDVITNSKSIIGNGKELDIYIPSKNLAIEYNGLYWHSDAYVSNDYHLVKTEKCKEKGVRLIHIFEDEWLTKPEIVKSRLRNILGCNEVKIFARKCVVKELSNKEVRSFLNGNHIQGHVNAKVSLGLFYNDELVSAMTFSSLRKNLGQTAKEDSYELLRFCNKLNTSVVGGASKLLSFFEKRFKPKMVISYADRRWSEGELYTSLGFEFEHLSQPNYFYVRGNQRENRFKYRKSELVKQGHDPSKSERVIMGELGYVRIYDCGAMRFVKNYRNN